MIFIQNRIQQFFNSLKSPALSTSLWRCFEKEVHIIAPFSCSRVLFIMKLTQFICDLSFWDKMAASCRWKDDDALRTDLNTYVRQSMKRSKIIEFVKRDYPDYSWSIPTLDRRLRHFNISYIEYETPLEDVYAAVQTELSGPGKLLGYRALNQKLRIKHGVKVPRHLIHNVMADLDQAGLDRRNLKKRQR